MEELDLKELLNIFWKKKVQVILIIAIFIVTGIIYTVGFVTPEYTASTTLVLAKADEATTTEEVPQTTDSITTTDVTLNSKLVSTYSELVKSKNVLRQVISNLNIDVKEEELRENVTVSSVKDTELIQITVTNRNPTYAAKIANEIANVFTKKIGEIYNINNVHVVDEAEVANTPSNVNHAKDVIIFAAVGLVIAITYVLISNMLDTTIKTAEEVEKAFKIPVLVSIPVYDFDNERGGKR